MFIDTCLREVGDIRLFVSLVQKFNVNVFLFVGSKTLGTTLNFDWLVHSVECPNDSTTNSKLEKG